MIIYHEVASTSLPSVLANGLKRTSHGIKTNEKAIVKADEFLDTHRPVHLQTAGVSRQKSIYGYIGDESTIRDIKDGSRTAVNKKQRHDGQTLLQLKADLQYCWVSDLDKYDELKAAISSGVPHETCLKLCDTYWSSLQPLADYNKTITRPEVMITCNIPPSNIEPL